MELIKIKHRRDGYIATADDIRVDQMGQVIAYHIPLIGWRSIEEFETVEEEQ